MITLYVGLCVFKPSKTNKKINEFSSLFYIIVFGKVAMDQ